VGAATIEARSEASGRHGMTGGVTRIRHQTGFT
jgi:hypothetical protein